MRHTLNNLWNTVFIEVVKYMIAIGLFILILLGVSWSQRNNSKETKANTQLLVCSATIPVEQKTAVNLKKCRDTVEQDSGLKLQHYEERIDFEK